MNRTLVVAMFHTVFLTKNTSLHVPVLTFAISAFNEDAIEFGPLGMVHDGISNLVMDEALSFTDLIQLMMIKKSY